MKSVWLIATAATLTVFPACESKKTGEANPTARGAVSATPKPAVEESGKANSVQIPSLKLAMDAPQGTKASEVMVGIVAVEGPGLSAGITVADEHTATTVEEEKKKSQMTKPTDMKDEKLSDGWVLTYEGNIEGGKRALFAEVDRTIDGTRYRCGSTVDTEKKRQATISVCKSLRRSP